jgi:hypothetical protein
MDLYARGTTFHELTETALRRFALVERSVNLHAVAEERSTMETARTVGRVTSVDSTTFTLLTPAGKLQQIGVDDTTVVFRTAPGDADDITDDSRLVVKYHVDSPSSAQEVIVLPGDSPYGFPVIEREPDWVTVKNAFGKSIETYLGYSAIKRTKLGSYGDDVEKGSMLFGFIAWRTRDDNEIEFTGKVLIVLPEDTAFGS